MNFDPDVIEVAPERTRESIAYFRLFAAVLHRGIVDYATSRIRMEPAEFHASEVYDWLWEDDWKGIGSLHWLCSVLGYDVRTVRDRVVSNSRMIAEWERRGAKKTQGVT